MLQVSLVARYAINTVSAPAARQWIQQLREHQRLSPADLEAIVSRFQERFRRSP